LGATDAPFLKARLTADWETPASSATSYEVAPAVSESFLFAITPHPDVSLLLMTSKAFDRAEARTIFSHHRAGLVGQHALIGTRLDELANPEAAGEAGVLPGGRSMVRADDLVAIGNVGARAKNSAP